MYECHFIQQKVVQHSKSTIFNKKLHLKVSKKEVTPNGVTYTTGQIPITVVQPPKPAKRSQVPIYTLEREPVPLTREAPADQLDDDFEFEFIDIDS